MLPYVAKMDFVRNPGGGSRTGGGISLGGTQMVADYSLGEYVRYTFPAATESPKLRILVVDDLVDSADTLAEVLKCYGHIVQVCYSGASALAIVPQFRPHVCLLDLAMPGMNGLELANQLKAQARTGPLVLIATTAFGDLETRTNTALMGFHYHFTKPVDLTALVEAITKLGKQLRTPFSESAMSNESLIG